MSFGSASEAAKFSSCMRKHGIAAFPDPNKYGAIQFGSAQKIDQHSLTFNSARHACLQLLPNNGQPTPAQLAHAQRQWLAFAKCMRAHGIADFPYPAIGGPPEIRPSGDLAPNNPGLQSAERGCHTHLNGVLGGDKFLHDSGAIRNGV